MEWLTVAQFAEKMGSVKSAVWSKHMALGLMSKRCPKRGTLLIADTPENRKAWHGRRTTAGRTTAALVAKSFPGWVTASAWSKRHNVSVGVVYAAMRKGVLKTKAADGLVVLIRDDSANSSRWAAHRKK